MHHGTLVIIAPTDDIDGAVAAMIGPYGDGREWDWYQIGGRWTGCLSNGAYDPEKDPANRDPERPGEAAWPTQWKRYEGDVKPLALVTQEQLNDNFYAVCCESGYFPRKRYTPWTTESKFPEQDMPTIEWLQQEYPDGIAVVVDMHS